MPNDLRRALACLISSSSSLCFGLLFDFFSGLSLFECRFGDGERLASLVSCDLQSINMRMMIQLATHESMEEEYHQISQTIIRGQTEFIKISFLHMVSMASGTPCIAVAQSSQRLGMVEMLLIAYTEWYIT